MESVKIFGEDIIDSKAIAQLKNCMVDGSIGTLTADAHVGYSMPIGGAIAYKDKISPSGVGYDIGCITGDANILLDNRAFIKLKDINEVSVIVCADDNGVLRTVNKNEGLKYSGQKETISIKMQNGRNLICTEDHLVMTLSGWKAAGTLSEEDYVLNSTYEGYEYEKCNVKLPAPFDNIDDDAYAALMRVLGIVMTDGHVSKDGKSVSIYTAQGGDVKSIMDDISKIGLNPYHYYRERTSTNENNIKINSILFNNFLNELGCPRGKKAFGWEYNKVSWLLQLPNWLLSNFMSAVLSGEATRPRTHINGGICNTAIKQSGNKIFLQLLKDILLKLGFETSEIILSRQAEGAITESNLIQVLGGSAKQVGVFEKIGYCYHSKKRRLAASVTSAYYQRKLVIDNRILAYYEARKLRNGEVKYKYKEVMDIISKKYSVSPYFVRHCIYSNRGEPRFDKTTKNVETYPFGECYYNKIESIKRNGVISVYDIITSDELHRFNANGVVVHNCGNMAIRTDLVAKEIRVDWIMDEIVKRISFGVGRPNNEKIDHEVLEKIANSDFKPQRKMAQLAAAQLGTVGSGNHFCDLFEDENGFVWIGVHFGSRGFGHKTATGFMALSQGLEFDGKPAGESMDAPPTLFDVNSEIGQEYIQAMQLAGEYAYAGRECVVNKVLEILGNPKVTFSVHNHHNFAWLENHFGEDYWVVRKGCTPAFAGQQGFIGANMRDTSVIVEGIDSEWSRAGLFSTVHGAGRVLSRTAAAGKKKWIRNEEGKKVQVSVSKGLVDFDEVKYEMSQRNVVLRGAGADEAPACYKSLEEVLKYQGDTIKILHRLNPIGVAMAGGEFDPYKD